MRTSLFPLAFLLLGVSLTAQQPAETPPAKCSIEGQVVRAGTGEPLKKARVILRKAEGRDQQPNSAVTGLDGRFLLKDIEPGRYRLLAGRNGYVRQEYGQRGPRSPGTILTLAPGQQLRDLVFRLTPGAVIAGRVYDEEGEAVPGARIEALQYGYSQNKRQLFPAGRGATNDRGDYRLFGLAPGRYYISSTYTPGMAWGMMGGMSYRQSEGMSGSSDEESYVPTYYPGTGDPAQAVPLEVQAGDEVGGIDFVLLPTRAVKVRGRVSNSITGKPSRDISIWLFPRETRVWMFSFENRARVDETRGTFELARVVPGSYYLMAGWYNEEDRQFYTARLPIDVGSTNLEGVELVIGRGLQVAGRLQVEAPGAMGRTSAQAQATGAGREQKSAQLELGELRVGLRPRDSIPQMGGQGGRLKEDGSFLLENVPVGEYTVGVYQRGELPEDYYLKSARLSGVNVLEEGLNLSGPVRDTLELVLSPRGGRVEGAVLTQEGQPFGGARVVLVPEPPRRQRTELYKTAATDQYGRFTLRGVPPGEYKLFAWEEVETGAYQDPDFLRPYEERGKAVRVEEGARLGAELKLIPAESRAP